MSVLLASTTLVLPRLVFDTSFTKAGTPAPTTQILQHNEKALITRVQLSF